MPNEEQKNRPNPLAAFTRIEEDPVVGMMNEAVLSLVSRGISPEDATATVKKNFDRALYGPDPITVSALSKIQK